MSGSNLGRCSQRAKAVYGLSCKPDIILSLSHEIFTLHCLLESSLKGGTRGRFVLFMTIPLRSASSCQHTGSCRNSSDTRLIGSKPTQDAEEGETGAVKVLWSTCGWQRTHLSSLGLCYVLPQRSNRLSALTLLLRGLVSG